MPLLLQASIMILMKIKLPLKVKINFSKNVFFLKFPYFIRKFNATFITRGFKYALWIFLYICILTNLLASQLFKPDAEKSLRNELMKSPKEVSLHEKLGQYYLTINEKEAQKEYILAQKYYLLSEQQKNNVLGTQTSPWQRWTEAVTKREKLKRQVEYWEKIHRKLPSYVYAALKLATLNYQLGNKEKAKDYLEIALKEDPVNQMALEMAERLK